MIDGAILSNLNSLTWKNGENMLTVNKNLKAKEICGKKYRSPAFTMSAIFSIPFIIVAVLTSLSIPQRDGRGAIIVLIFVVWLALPVAMMISFRERSYIMCENKLYFFHSQVTCLANEKRKKLRRVRTNGSVEYSDMKDFRYIGIEFEGYRKQTIVPPRVVIIGDDFEVEIYAYKSLIKRIKELQHS